MTVPPESIEVSKCYLTTSGHVRHVRFISEGRKVQYQSRPAHQEAGARWPVRWRSLTAFAASVEREVSCDWTPEQEG